MEGIIYAFRNKINGKYYVGQTTNLGVRKNRHLKGTSLCWLFNRAMLKHGRDAFEFMILESGIQSREELDRLEKKHIAETKAYPKGYNLTPGGRDHGEEQDKRISVSTKNRWAAMSEEQRRSISEKCRAKAKEQWDAIPKEKRAEVLKNSISSSKERSEKCKKVSIAIKYLSQINMQIKKAHREERKKLEEERIQSNPHSLEMRRRRQVGKRKVLCIETGDVYESAHEASRITGICRINIVQVCNPNNYKVTAGGYHWKYAL